MFVSLYDSIQSSSLIRYWKKYSMPALGLLLFLFLLFSWADNMIPAADTSPVYWPLFNTIFQVLRYATYAAMGLAIVLNVLALRAYHLWTAGLTGLVGLAAFFFSRSMPLMILLLFLFSFAPLKFKIGLRIYLYAQTAILLGVILLSAFHILPDVIMDTARARHALGFTWVTTPSVLFLFLLFALVLLKPKAINTVTYCALLGCTVGLFFLTDTNFTFLATFAFLLVFGLYKIRPAWFAFTKSKWYFYCLIALPVILSVFWLLVTVFYSPDNTILARLNGILSGRIANSKAALDQFGLTVFGSKITWVGRTAGQSAPQNYLYVDCSYLNILLNYGVLFWALVMGWCMRMVHQAWLRKDSLLLVILFFLFVFSVYEVRLINPLYNPFLLTFARSLAHPLLPAMGNTSGFHLPEALTRLKTKLSAPADKGRLAPEETPAASTKASGKRHAFASGFGCKAAAKRKAAPAKTAPAVDFSLASSIEIDLYPGPDEKAVSPAVQKSEPAGESASQSDMRSDPSTSSIESESAKPETETGKPNASDRAPADGQAVMPGALALNRYEVSEHPLRFADSKADSSVGNSPIEEDRKEIQS